MSKLYLGSEKDAKPNSPSHGLTIVFGNFHIVDVEHVPTVNYTIVKSRAGRTSRQALEVTPFRVDKPAQSLIFPLAPAHPKTISASAYASRSRPR
jgi:hypothetical protein